MNYINREIEPTLLQSTKQFPVLAITGARQTGKSTLLTHLFKDYNYVTFDDPMLRVRALDDPALFIDSIPNYTIFDEIQYVPELLPLIKMRVDKEWPDSDKSLFLLTGSQPFILMKNLTESLAGRIALFQLLPFSSSEIHINKKTTLPKLFSSIFKGFFPLIISRNADPKIFYPSYIQTYIERDIRQITSVHDLTIFQNFLQLIAARAGSILNVTEISKECGISHTTGRNWLSLLESSGIIYLLKPYFKNITKRIIKSPKLYFTDTGLLAFLLRYQSSESLMSGPIAGHIFENFIINEVLKNIVNSTLPYDIYYYRDSHKNEIDLIIEKADTLVMCEIKMRKTINKKDVKTIEKIELPGKENKKYVVSMYEEECLLSKDIINLPYWNIISIMS